MTLVCVCVDALGVNWGSECLSPYPQDCISIGSGEPPQSHFKSLVFRHTNNPRWAETVKLTVPIEQYKGTHIRFEYRHCSSKSCNSILHCTGLIESPTLTC